MLAIAPDGSLVLIELKRNRTPREVVAQAIDYAAWVEGLTAGKIAQIFARFFGRREFRRSIPEDARKYGFISAGGGSWYSKTLKLLSPGDRVWVMIPGQGFVGVGRVIESVQAANDFDVETLAGLKPVTEVLQTAAYLNQHADDPEMPEYLVRVEWADTVPEQQAFKEVGLFGNQNSVCQPTSPKWRHTVERLKSIFCRWNSDSVTRS